MMRSSLAFYVILAMSAVLMGAEGKQSAHDAAPFILKTGSGTVDALRPDGSLLQSLPYEGDEPEEPEITGLNLTVANVPDTSFPLDVMILHSGEWWLRQCLDDRPALLESRRLPAADFGDEAARRLIVLEWPLAREISVEPFPELSEKLTYPALKAEFLDGENEDARQFAAALVFTDEWSFWFVLEAPADGEPLAAGGSVPVDAEAQNAMLSSPVKKPSRRAMLRQNRLSACFRACTARPKNTPAADFSSPDATIRLFNRAVRREMEKFLLGIDFVDPENGDFLPGPGLPVYDSGAEALKGMSVMDALIRIKKLVGPEESRWLGEGRIAYRYDGTGAVAGVPSLLFSFGGDSREKFTAIRHFAVDETGAVHDMNADASHDESKPHPIDAELEKRMDADYSTAGMIAANNHAIEEWEKLLDENYRALMEKMDEEQRERLRASQDAWAQYRDLEFGFDGRFWAGFDGTMYRLFPSGFQMDFVKERALRLGNYLREINGKISANDAPARR